jgi:hypothetical protein
MPAAPAHLARSDFFKMRIPRQRAKVATEANTPRPGVARPAWIVPKVTIKMKLASPPARIAVLGNIAHLLTRMQRRAFRATRASMRARTEERPFAQPALGATMETFLDPMPAKIAAQGSTAHPRTTTPRRAQNVTPASTRTSTDHFLAKNVPRDTTKTFEDLVPVKFAPKGSTVHPSTTMPRRAHCARWGGLRKAILVKTSAMSAKRAHSLPRRESLNASFVKRAGSRTL